MKVPAIPVTIKIRPIKGFSEDTSDINSLFPLLKTSLLPFSPSLISLMVSVDVKHRVYTYQLYLREKIQTIKGRTEGTSDTYVGDKNQTF